MNDESVRVDVSGLEELLRDEPQRVEDLLDWLAEDIVTEIKLSFGSSPPGKTYQRGSVSHTASQPGNPPNVDTGALRASIRWEKTGKLERTVSDGVEYGLGLEDGTERIAPRPFFRPAFDKGRQTLERDAASKLRLEE